MMKSQVQSGWLAVSLVLLHLNVCLVTGEGVSLAFIFDATGSMSDELAQAQSGATRILNAALSNPQEILHDFILVPFRDPVIGPTTVTTDRVDFEKKLAGITVSGGGDCPESAIGAIKEGLEVAHERSFIYVFTDASANDYDLCDEVIELVQQKKSKVNFVMTGDCGSRSEPGYICYQRIASASSGEVFTVEKGQVGTILDSVIETTIPKGPPRTGGPSGRPINDSSIIGLPTVEYGDVNLISLSFNSRGNTDDYLMNIDSQLADFTISLSGDKYSLEVYDPSGKLVDPSRFKVILSLDSVYKIKFDKPQPGNWTISFSSSSFHTLRVTGTSIIDFDQKFGVSDIVSDFEAALPRPVTGIPVYTFIKAFGLEGGVLFTQLEYLSLDGKVLSTFTLNGTRSIPDVFYGGPKRPPKTLFNLQVSGYDINGYPFVRLSKSAFSSVNTTGIEQCLRCAPAGTSRCLVLGKVDPKYPNNTKFTCECKGPYFKGNGITCTNVDECDIMTDNCDTNAVCTDTYGSFTCDCMSGYSGDGVVCSNINECALPGLNACGGTGSCSDTIGSFNCACYSGYESSNITAPLCKDIDECSVTSNGGCEHYCNNTVGSFHCQCFSGFREGDNSTTNGVNCTDINECMEGTYTCPLRAICRNTNGSYDCPTCEIGYKWNDNGTVCIDVDECADNIDSCTDNHNCVNTEGSYQCICKEGYQGNETYCENIDECRNAASNDCDANANCTDTIGSYTCDCNPGYSGNGINCTEIDECQERLDNCDPKYGICTNTEGSFVCSCIYGYTGEVKCSEVHPNSSVVGGYKDHLSNTAAVFKMYSLEAERQSLEMHHEQLLRQCAIKARRPRGKRAVLSPPTAAIDRKQVDILTSTLEIAVRKLKEDLESIKKACGL